MPITLATMQGDPTGIAIDSVALYWTDLDGGLIKKLPLGGGANISLATLQDGPIDLAVDGSTVFWINIGPPGSVMKVPAAGGVPTELASEPEQLFGAIAVDATYVYWTSAVGTIMRVSVNGGTPEQLASMQDNPVDIALDATSIYWVNNSPSGSVMKLAK